MFKRAVLTTAVVSVFLTTTAWAKVPSLDGMTLIDERFIGCQVPFIPDTYRREYNQDATDPNEIERAEFGLFHEGNFSTPVVVIIWKVDSRDVAGIYLIFPDGTEKTVPSLETLKELFPRPCDFIRLHQTYNLQRPSL